VCGLGRWSAPTAQQPEGVTLRLARTRAHNAAPLPPQVEKAHPEVFNVLLSILDDGRVTDAKGRTGGWGCG